jgi:hypothetical protein
MSFVISGNFLGECAEPDNLSTQPAMARNGFTNSETDFCRFHGSDSGCNLLELILPTVLKFDSTAEPIESSVSKP